MIALVRTFTYTFFVSGLLAACTSCTTERDPAALGADAARAFHRHNQRADLTPFDGITVRVTRPVLERDTRVLGHVYSISFCKEVVDVRGYRATADLEFSYSDWPPMQHTLARRARHDSVGRQRLAELFNVRPAEARATFAAFAAETVRQFRQLAPPGAPAEVRAIRACVSDEGHPTIVELTNGIELIHLPPDTENSLHWTKARRTFERLGPNWYWRRPRPTELTADNPAGM